MTNLPIPQHDSQLVRVIAADRGFLERIRGAILIMAEAREAVLTDTERQLLDDLDGDAMRILAEEIASNGTVFAAIKGAILEGDIAGGIQRGLVDDDLEFVIGQELPRLVG